MHVNAQGMSFTWIPSDSAEVDPVRGRGIWFGVTEVTRGQVGRWRPWPALPLTWEEREARDLELLPAYEITPLDCVAFAGWLSKQDSRWTYRLPTEAEWKAACAWNARHATRELSRRENTADAGSLTRWSSKTLEALDRRPGWRERLTQGDDRYAGLAPVGTYGPVGGICDLVGNVAELCGPPDGRFFPVHGITFLDGGVQWSCDAPGIRIWDGDATSSWIGFRLVAVRR